MNLIHKTPIGLKTFLDYALFLIASSIMQFFKKGYVDVRILFDMSGTQGLSPKIIEQQRRDKGEKEGLLDEIHDTMPLPQKWETFLKVRQNKHMLVNYLCITFLKYIQPVLYPTRVGLADGKTHPHLY